MHQSSYQNATLTLIEFHPLGEKITNYFTEKPDYSNNKVMAKIRKELSQLKKDTASDTMMWQKTGSYLKKQGGAKNAWFSYKMTNAVPYITDELVTNFSKDLVNSMVRYCVRQTDWTIFGKIIAWMRPRSNFSPMKSEIKAIHAKGGLIPLFQAGLTHEEFENELDPNLELNVEIEYKKVDPNAWFFKTVEIIYVRKKFR